MKHRYRWSDNQKKWWRFIYSYNNTYKHIGITLKSRNPDSEDEYCILKISLHWWTFIVLLPDIISPHVVTVIPKYGKSNIPYDDYTTREYGFSLSDSYAQFFYGKQTDDSNDEQRTGFFLPFMQWRYVEVAYYDEIGLYFASIRKEDEENDHDGDKLVPRLKFMARDYDGELVTATTFIREYRYKLGTGWFKWLAMFRKDRIVRALDITFDKETGGRKGSWKGGTLGCSVEITEKEAHMVGFKRYCENNLMEFLGVHSDEFYKSESRKPKAGAVKDSSGGVTIRLRSDTQR
jgi:hypothetical protein